MSAVLGREDLRHNNTMPEAEGEAMQSVMSRLLLDWMLIICPPIKTMSHRLMLSHTWGHSFDADRMRAGVEDAPDIS